MAERSAQARTRRRFARRQWARRWLTLRYVLVVLLLVGGTGLGIYALFFSSWLAVEGTEVVGTDQLTEAEVLDAAEVPTGGPLARVDLDAIEVRVRSLSTVKSVDVSRKWPHDVRIEIVERTPIAVVDRGDTLTNLDAEGHTFGQVTRAPSHLPRVEVGANADPDALVEGAEVVAALDDEVRMLVDHVEVESVDRIVLMLRDGREVRWGSAEQSDEKAEVLLLLLEEDAQIYDVSVPGLPTTQG